MRRSESNSNCMKACKRSSTRVAEGKRRTKAVAPEIRVKGYHDSVGRARGTRGECECNGRRGGGEGRAPQNVSCDAAGSHSPSVADDCADESAVWKLRVVDIEYCDVELRRRGCGKGAVGLVGVASTVVETGGAAEKTSSPRGATGVTCAAGVPLGERDEAGLTGVEGESNEGEPSMRACSSRGAGSPPGRARHSSRRAHRRYCCERPRSRERGPPAAPGPPLRRARQHRLRPPAATRRAPRPRPSCRERRRRVHERRGASRWRPRRRREVPPRSPRARSRPASATAQAAAGPRAPRAP